jgi:hypothetical protein
MITAVRITAVRLLFRQMFRQPIWKIIGLLLYLIFLIVLIHKIPVAAMAGRRASALLPHKTRH